MKKSNTSGSRIKKSLHHRLKLKDKTAFQETDSSSKTTDSSIDLNDLFYINQVLAKGLQTKFTPQVTGYVDQVVGSIIKATMTNVQIGEICLLQMNNAELEAEVIGFKNNQVVLSPIGDMYGIAIGTKVIPTGRVQQVPVGKSLLGRVINALGEAYDGAGPVEYDLTYPLHSNPPNPMSRKVICDPLPLGIRAIDCLLTMGQGQRMGIFAAAGVGKSKLISSVIRGTKADIVVLALIGERGREVRDFIEHDLGPEGMKHTVVVVSTSDQTAMQRLKGAFVATTIAEYFRDQGQNVLLLMDSVTRFARALREIGLAAGEPPARRGFPPSVFANLPRLMERAGNSDKGSISALYTVLVEGDDMTEPIADETRSILDGHIVLSRKLAAKNHYPAIDILESVSRTMDSVTKADHLAASRKLRELMALYQEIELLLKIGEYKTGSDPKTDLAVQKHEAIEEFLKQKMQEVTNFQDSLQQLLQVVS